MAEWGWWVWTLVSAERGGGGAKGLGRLDGGVGPGEAAEIEGEVEVEAVVFED